MITAVGVNQLKVGVLKDNGALAFQLANYPGNTFNDYGARFINNHGTVAGAADTADGYYRSTVWLYNTSTGTYNDPIDLTPSVVGFSRGLNNNDMALFYDGNGYFIDPYLWHPSVGKYHWSYPPYSSSTAFGVLYGSGTNDKGYIYELVNFDAFVTGCNMSTLYENNPVIQGFTGYGCADDHSEIAGVGAWCTPVCPAGYTTQVTQCNYQIAWTVLFELCTQPTSPSLSSSSQPTSSSTGGGSFSSEALSMLCRGTGAIMLATLGALIQLCI